MKQLAGILALLIFTVSLSPCADSICEAEQEACEETEHSGEHDAHPDFCSPFCICSCCANVFAVDSRTIASIHSQFAILNIKVPVFRELELVDFHWQPPRV